MGRNIIKAAGALLLINAGVKLLGFVREMVMAGVFGASALVDAYQVAYTLPYFFQTVLGYAFVSAVLPLLSRYWQEDGDNTVACRLGSTLINIVAAGMLVLCLLGMAAARGLVWLTAPELGPDTAELATSLARIIFPSVLFMSVGMVISGILNCRYRFVAAAMAPGMTSLCIIVAVAFMAGGRIEAAAWGTLAGFIGFFLVTVVDLPRTGFRYIWCWDIRHPEIKRVLLDILPIVLGLAVTQIYTIINRIFASGLHEGSIAVLNYANKVMNLPLGVFVAAIITASFPLLADKARQVDHGELSAAVRRNLAMIALIALPSALGLMVLSRPIVQLLFEGGAFTATDTLLTARCLAFMAPCVLFLGLSMLLIRVYYALGDVKTPLLTGAVSIGVNVVMSWLCLNWFHGAEGLGLANSAAAAVNAGLLWRMLRDKIEFRETVYQREMKLLALAGVASGLCAWALRGLVMADKGRMILLLTLAAVIAAVVILYFAALMILKSASLKEVKNALSGGKNRAKS